MRYLTPREIERFDRRAVRLKATAVCFCLPPLIAMGLGEAVRRGELLVTLRQAYQARRLIAQDLLSLARALVTGDDGY